MVTGNDNASLIVHLEKPESMSVEEYTQLTHALMLQLRSQDIASVELAREQVVSVQGTKGDPFTIGAIVIVVVQAVLPKVMDFLQAWSLRGEGHTIKIKVQRGNQSAEIEYPAKVSAEQARKHLDNVMGELWKNSSHS